MGTRNLTAVFYNGEYKVAQYGQWDGYPDGVGIAVLEFIRAVDIKEFKKKLSKVRFITEEEKSTFHIKYPDWVERFPHLSRDAGAKILKYVMHGATDLKNSINFAGDSLFCEWCYVIDLDKGTLEVFKGFNKKEITEGRFKSNDKNLEINKEYHPVKLWKSYLLKKLPTNKKFLEELEDKESY